MDNLSTFPNILSFASLLILHEVYSAEIGYDENGPSKDNGSAIFSVQNVLISLSVLCSLVLVIVGCTWAWWRRVLCFWRQSGTHEAPEHYFVPEANFASLDARNLYRDAGGQRNGIGSGSTNVQIESLPTLHDLGLDGRDSFELRSFRTPSIITVPNNPFNEAPNVQDWFQEPQINFPRGNLEYQQVIGKGWFGKVLEAEAINIKQYVRASNVVARELRNNATEQDQIRFLSEARMFREAQSQSCDHVLKLLGFCVEQMPYILIFEYFPLGDLKTYLKAKAKQAPGDLKAGDDGILTRMIIDIIRGVKWMEQAGFIHGDLAARNCLVATPAGKVVIGDYGHSSQKFKLDYYWSSGYAVPIRWAAPETLAVEDGSTMTGAAPQVKVLEITNSANIWSLGVLIWEVFQLGKTPYENLTDQDVISRVITGKKYILEPPQLHFVRDSTKDKIYQLLVTCWNSSPSHRPTIDIIEKVFTTP